MKKLFDQTTSEVGIPGMTVNDIGLLDRAGHDQVSKKSIQQFLMAGILEWNIKREADPVHCLVRILLFLITKAEDLDSMNFIIQGGELPGEILEVDSGASINVRGIFVC